jgi:DHA3 family macrolide efflux protein-like MFS transporter
MNHWQPRFFTVWFGQAFSLVGSSLTQFVLVWWITQSTSSPSALAIAGVMGLLPTALFSPLGGAIADRFSRRKVMIVTDAVTATCMVVLVALFATGRTQLWQVYLLMFIRATMQSFQQPAAAASTANLVPEQWLTRVAGMNQVLQGVMTIASAPLGALVLTFLPIQGALMIDVVTALLGITPLFFYVIPQPRQPDHLLTPAALLHDIRSGANYVLARPGLKWLYMITGLVVLTVMPTFSLTPLLVTQHFGGGINEVALLEGFAGVGIIAGGVFISLWPLFKRRVITILVSFALSCATVALTALMPGAWLWLATVWWTISGFTFSAGSAPLTALLQSVAPNELQGRILALLNMVVGLAAPAGLLIAGPLGEALGVRSVFILGGGLSALICLGGLFSETLWNLEHPQTVTSLSAPADKSISGVSQ